MPLSACREGHRRICIRFPAAHRALSAAPTGRGVNPV
jgi:hypothetical protein